jgi:hypothetical protein
MNPYYLSLGELLSIDFNFTIAQIIELCLFIVAATTFYVRGIRAFNIVARVQAAAANLGEFRTSVDATLSSFKGEILNELCAIKGQFENNLTLMQASQTSMEKRLEAMDEKFVRKDVHDAHLQLIHSQLKSLDKIERLMTAHVPTSCPASKRGGRK